MVSCQSAHAGNRIWPNSPVLHQSHIILRVFLFHTLRRHPSTPVSMLDAFAQAPHQSPARASSPCRILLFDPMAPSLPRRRPCPIKANQSSNLGDLHVVSCGLHSMREHAFSVLKQKLAAHLLHVAALPSLLARAQSLEDRLHRIDEHVGLHVCGLVAKFQGSCHAELVVQFACWLGVDGKRARGGIRVHGNQLWLAAADDRNGSGSWQRQEVFWLDRGRHGTQILLTVLSTLAPAGGEEMGNSLRRRSVE